MHYLLGEGTYEPGWGRSLPYDAAMVALYKTGILLLRGQMQSQEALVPLSSFSSTLCLFAV